MRARHSRDLYDLDAIWRSSAGPAAVDDDELRAEVVRFKQDYFPSKWARYDEAIPGTFKVVPHPYRIATLRADYRDMRPMFLTAPRPFDELLESLREIEERINSRA